MNFQQKLDKITKKNKSFVCVGLDSDYSVISQFYKEKSVEKTIFLFNKKIVDSTFDLVCAYKPNSAFYEAYGVEGLNALSQTIDYIKKTYPEIPIILDAKRADIGNTNNGYVKFAFDTLNADAVTLHPYLGKEALEPFLARKDKGIIILVRTSNPGAGEFQDLLINKQPLYQIVAKNIAKNWNLHKNCGVVVGATYPKELKIIRKIVGDMPILIPGIGAQGGDIKQTVCAGKNSKVYGIIINSSRFIILASKNKDFAKVARQKTIELKDQI
ncbi:MAG: orotidine-5'-phosphate decarboxylase, partial [bacterium]|nr:orotidine-5'-phosphate decarboxylase [bacterium]